MAENRPVQSRRWFQFRLRTLLIAVLLLSLPLSWFAVRMERARKQGEAVDAIERLGGDVLYDYEYGRLPGPFWLLNLLGEDFFADVAVVGCTGGDEVLQHVKGFANLKELYVEGRYTTDVGLEHVKGLTRLEELDVSFTSISDQGLMHVAGLTQLKRMVLTNNQVTDAGLKHLRGLSQLELLYLTEDRVTEEGRKELQRALPNCRIEPFIARWHN